MSDLQKRAEDTWNLLATSPDVVHKVLVDALRTERRLALEEALAAVHGWPSGVAQDIRALIKSNVIGKKDVPDSK